MNGTEKKSTGQRLVAKMRMCSERCVCCPAVGQRTKQTRCPVFAGPEKDHPDFRRQAWFSFCLRYGQAEAANPLHCLPRAVDTRYGQVKCQVNKYKRKCRSSGTVQCKH
ncbi:hypothetical protein T11_9176 [Trichinella zimbabwensis]|uniref:Uncharacterized protein n=1 Tax=Trichinella zimbabwensis TaxID=268475 RepID=A0A0V1H349_9BILA|nr:hypothetical protein T11_9176 [Trichinella zimbabwensis]